MGFVPAPLARARKSLAKVFGKRMVSVSVIQRIVTQEPYSGKHRGMIMGTRGSSSLRRRTSEAPRVLLLCVFADQPTEGVLLAKGQGAAVIVDPVPRAHLVVERLGLVDEILEGRSPLGELVQLRLDRLGTEGGAGVEGIEGLPFHRDADEPGNQGHPGRLLPVQLFAEADRHFQGRAGGCLVAGLAVRNRLVAV